MSEKILNTNVLSDTTHPADKTSSYLVLERPIRRRFSNEEKMRILRLADACTQYGQLGALLRREGIYSSHLTAFRKQRAEGRLDAKTKNSGRSREDIVEIGRLRLQLEKSNRKLAQAELIIDVQKKVAQLLGIPIEETVEDISQS